MLRSAIVVAALAIAVAVTGCSTFEGRHLAPGEKLPGPDWYLLSGNGGIPYNLPTAQYTLQRTIVDGQARYGVGVAYAPDPAQRFTLRVDPAFLTSVGFDVGLGEKGELNQVGATTKDQVVPTIQAIGAIVGSIVTGSFPGFRTVKPSHEETSLPLDDLLPDCKLEESAANSLVCRYVRLVAEKDSLPEPTRKHMVIFARRYVLDYFGKPLPQINDSGFRSDLHARTVAEQEVLTTIEQRLRPDGALSAATEKVLKSFDEIAKSCLSTDPSNKIAQSLRAAFAGDSTRQLADVARQALVGRREALTALLGVAAGEPAPNLQTIDQVARALLIAIEPGPSGPEAIKKPRPSDRDDQAVVCGGHDLSPLRVALWKAARKRVAEAELQETLQEAITLRPDEWRARHLRYLDLRLAEIGRRLLLTGPSPGPGSAGAGETPRTCPLPQIDAAFPASADEAEHARDAATGDYASCVEERAWTIGEYETLRLLHDVEKQLAKLPPPTGEEGGGGYEEYASLRALAASLREQLDQAASSARQAGMAPGVKPFDPKEVPIVALACVVDRPGSRNCNSVEDWPAEADTAEFVITLTKLAGDAP